MAFITVGIAAKTSAAVSTDAEITSDAGTVVDQVATESVAKPLSVAPSIAVAFTYPPNRPSWVDHQPDMSGDLHRWPVVSTPASTAELSRQGLAAQLRAAAETYVETILGEANAASVITIDDDWIESHLSADLQYEGEVFAGDEVMYESATQLLFEPTDRQSIQTRWKSHQVGERLVGLAIVAFIGGALLFVTTAGMSVVVRRAERRVTQALDQ
ncbi:MAG TPA: hypothetical protein DDZ51_22635 [Planctomycetaceae bacterium]|nr:hypothetical protein [Planctomycetaceae bacterium]